MLITLKGKMKQLDKKIKDKVTGAIYDDISSSESSSDSMRNIWVDYLSKAVDNLF